MQILQICMDYSSLPDFRTLEIYEIRFFYNPLIPELIKHQKKVQENGE